MASTENDLLKKFIENEKNSQRWTLISVIIFVTLLFSTVYFMVKFQQKSQESQQKSVELDAALKKADLLSDSLRSQKQIVENALKRAETDKNKYEVWLEQSPSLTYKDSLKTEQKKVTVYIQYIKKYDAESKALLLLLQQKKYNAPGRELMKNATFTSSIKYFNDKDKPEADSLAKIINSTMAVFKRSPIRVLKNNINVPVGQIEVWLGDIQKLDTDELLKKYSY